MSVTPPTRPRVVLDCDPGVDDMFAIFCATRYCELLAITSVAGNVGIDHTTRNALDLVHLIGADVPVFRGAAGPFNGSERADASHVHGEGGMGGVALPRSPTDEAAGEATDALLDLTADGDVSVIAVGPLTNIAHAIERDPTWAQRVPRLVLMGGSSTTGNVGPFAEFNIWADPEAAAVVFEAGMTVTMAGLNLTRQVTMGALEIETMRASGTASAMAAADALAFYASFSEREYGLARSAMHDPCAVLDLVHPDLFERQSMHVAVETTGTYTRGMTVCDQRQNAQPANTDVLTKAAGDEVVALIIGAAIEPVVRS